MTDSTPRRDPLAEVDLAEVVAAVGQLLHAAGVPVTPERSGRLASTLALARPATVDELYWAGRVTLVWGTRVARSGTGGAEATSTESNPSRMDYRHLRRQPRRDRSNHSWQQDNAKFPPMR